jgi:hypothetical protein
LEEEGVDPVVGEWTDGKIRAMATNPCYLGLPAGNKKREARFYGIVEGRVERVEVDGLVKRRDRKDWVMPDWPIFTPLVDPARFARVNEKLAPRSRRAPKCEALYLAGLLYCGHCGRAMTGQAGCRRSKDSGQVIRRSPYYQCWTRHKFGKDNPTGCGAHCTRGEVIEPYIHEFLSRRGRTLDELIGAERDHAAFEALLREKADADAQVRALLEKAEAFVGANEEVLDEWTCQSREYWDGSDPDVILGDKSLWDDNPDNVHMNGLVWLCEQIRGHQAGRIEGEIAALEEEHEQLAGKIAMLTAPKMIEKLNARAGELESRIEGLKDQLVPMQERWDSLTDELRGLRSRMAEAQQVMAEGSDRAKAQALRDCIERIECTYDNSGRQSRLASVTIVPKVGAPETFRADRPKEQPNGVAALPDGTEWSVVRGQRRDAFFSAPKADH